MLGPYPIRALWRRARNAKSPKERHDTAYFAWEASVRLGVAARPPADAKSLTMPSTGQWVAALAAGDATLDHPALLRAASLFAEVVQGKPSAPRTVTARKLLDGLAAYRNQILGHGSTRAAEFYDDAAERLLDALGAAWGAGLFLPAEGKLVFVESVAIDGGGRRVARVVDSSAATLPSSRRPGAPPWPRPCCRSASISAPATTTTLSTPGSSTSRGSCASRCSSSTAGGEGRNTSITSAARG